MGNGQCPECYGVPEDWLGHPLYLDSKQLGHKAYCNLAKSLGSLGHTCLMQGESRSNTKYECYWTEQGILSTREIK